MAGDQRRQRPIDEEIIPFENGAERRSDDNQPISLRVDHMFLRPGDGRHPSLPQSSRHRLKRFWAAVIILVIPAQAAVTHPYPKAALAASQLRPSKGRTTISSPWPSSRQRRFTLIASG